MLVQCETVPGPVRPTPPVAPSCSPDSDSLRSRASPASPTRRLARLSRVDIITQYQPRSSGLRLILLGHLAALLGLDQLVHAAFPRARGSIGLDSCIVAVVARWMEVGREHHGSCPFERVRTPKRLARTGKMLSSMASVRLNAGGHRALALSPCALLDPSRQQERDTARSREGGHGQ